MAAPFAAGVANAQEKASDAGPSVSGTLEVVTVTARRRDENLQQVPIAVTALSGDQLDQRRINNLNALQYAAPSFEVWPVLANNMTATISLRGQVEPDLVPTYDPAVGLYLDGIYIARATGANLELVDMERAEVLRGPQGTLFGRNSIGGAISLVSNKPTRQFEGSLTASIGDFSERDLTGVLNVPLAGGKSALRLVARHAEHAGYGRAILLHRTLGDDDTNYVRAQLLIEPADAWTLDLSADMTKVRTGSQLVTLAAARPPATTIPVIVGNPNDDLARYVDPDPMAVLDNRAGNFDGLVWGTSAVLTGKVASVTIKSISAYRSLDAESNNTDFDGTPYDLWAMLRRDQVEHQFSQELQASGESKAHRVQWTAGLVYFTESGLLESRSIYLPQLYPGENWVRGTAYNDSSAAYAQATAEITAHTRLTAGIRYNEDQRQLVSRNAFVENGNVDCALSPEILDQPGVCRATLPRLRYSYVPFTLGLDYGATEDTLLYGKVSRGYRAGGFNMRGNTPLELLTFGPEEVTALEIGAKSDLLQKRLRINMALFESQYRDIQLGQFISDPEFGTTIVKQNAGEARIWGGEAEVTALIGRLQLVASAGLTDGRFTKLEPDVEDVTLDSVLVAPKTTHAIAGDLPIASRLGRIQIHADYSWRDTDTAGSDAYCRCDNSFGLLNAILELNLDQAGVVLSVWGRNLTDERYWNQSVDSGPVMNAIPGDPRTFGMTVRYKFGAQHP